MLILGVDTSSRHGTIALVRFSSQNSQTLELLALEGGTFSAQLVPQIAQALTRLHLTKGDIDGFAVVSGPGSFTGLRVGLAAIKALAEVLGKPIAAISQLEAIARMLGRDGEITSALDAGRGEIYLARCRVSGTQATIHEQQILRFAEFTGSNPSGEIVTPDRNIAELARENGMPVTQVDSPRADFIARVGFAKIAAGETISPRDLDANYIRRSDAEIKKFSLR
jgi:tRNA threonylcarbamoyladenosine biosynthesis protein TsaB